MNSGFPEIVPGCVTGALFVGLPRFELGTFGPLGHRNLSGVSI